MSLFSSMYSTPSLGCIGLIIPFFIYFLKSSIIHLWDGSDLKSTVSNLPLLFLSNALAITAEEHPLANPTSNTFLGFLTLIKV